MTRPNRCRKCGLPAQGRRLCFICGRREPSLVLQALVIFSITLAVIAIGLGLAAAL